MDRQNMLVQMKVGFATIWAVLRGTLCHARAHIGQEIFDSTIYFELCRTERKILASHNNSLCRATLGNIIVYYV